MNIFLRPAVLLAFCTISLTAQHPVTDEVAVTLPSTANVGNQVLQAGEYRIRQIPSSDNPRGRLQFIDRDGKMVEIPIVAMPALEGRSADETMVQFKQTTSGPYVSHVWIAGKSFGYQLPKPGEPRPAEATTQPEIPPGTPAMPQTNDTTPAVSLAGGALLLAIGVVGRLALKNKQ